MQLLSGDGIQPQQLWLCLGGSLLAAVLAVLVTIHLYRSERLAISV
jgi:sodium transport system permease protein